MGRNKYKYGLTSSSHFRCRSSPDTKSRPNRFGTLAGAEGSMSDDVPLQGMREEAKGVRNA